MYCTICESWKQNTGIFCRTCGGELERNINFYGKEFKQGNIEAYNSLYVLCMNRVKREVSNKIPEGLVDDCIQVIFLKMYNNIHSFDENKASFNTWFQTLRKNEMITFYNANSKYIQGAYEDPESILESIETKDEFTMPEVTIEKEECTKLLKEIIRELPKEQAECIYQFYFQNKKQKEIADTLGIQEGTVKSRLFKGKKSLKESVLNLEKKGIKLRGLSPIPFFMWLLQNAEDTGINLQKFQISNLATGASLGASSVGIKDAVDISGGNAVASNTIAGKTAVVAGNTTAKLIGVKALAVGIALAMVAAGSYVGVTKYQEYKNSDDNIVNEELYIQEEVTEEEIQAEESETKIEPVVDQYYKDVILAYYQYLESGLNSEEIPQAFVDAGVNSTQLGIVNCSMENLQTPWDLYYGLFDVNEDGTDELFIYVTDPHEFDSVDSYYVPTYDVWTVKDGAPNWLVASGYRTGLEICENGMLLSYGSGGATLWGATYYQIIDGALENVFDYTIEYVENESSEYIPTYYEDYLGGVRYSEETVMEKVEEYAPCIADIRWYSVKTLFSDEDTERIERYNQNIVLYEDIINQYEYLFYNFVLYPDSLEMNYEDYGTYEHFSVNMNSFSPESLYLYYTFYDLDGDDIDEILFRSTKASTDYTDANIRYKIDDIWTYKNGEITSMLQPDYLYICEDNKVVCLAFSGDGYVIIFNDYDSEDSREFYYLIGDYESFQWENMSEFAMLKWGADEELLDLEKLKELDQMYKPMEVELDWYYK